VTDFAEFHTELRSVAGELLAKSRDVQWSSLVEAGWAGLEVPEEFGGAGATFAEVAVICEEIGRAAGATSYLGSAVLAVGVLKALAPSNIRDNLLARAASGGIRLAVALDGQDFVPDAEGADHLLLVTTDGVSVVQAHADRRPVLDETRQLATVTAEDSGTETLHYADASVDPVGRLRDRAAVAVAADSLGIAEAMLTATVDYAKVRHQFGRPIGSLQAVKHACADMLVQVEVARQLVGAAVESVVQSRADAAASMAKAYATGMAVDVAGKAIQLHGGIGYTWESGLHVYLKRAALNRSLFGSPAAHRRQLAKRYR